MPRLVQLACLSVCLQIATASAAELRFPTTNPAGTLRAGDVVEFTVFDVYGPGTETPLVVRLDEEGRAKLPLLDEVKVAGLTNDAAGPLISKAYEAARIVSKNSAPVTVAIIATAAQMPVKPGPLAAGDTVRITVFELTGPGRRTSMDCCVAADGTITLPHVGQVKVAGQGDADAGRAITKAYQDGQIITNASVIVLRTASGT